MSDTDSGPRLDGRVALVTGSSSGLGARMVGTLNTAGVEVVLTGRNVDRLDQRAASMSGSPLVVPGDLRDAAFRASLIEAVRDHHGYLAVLVNAAGTCANGPLEEQSLTDVSDIIAIGLLAATDLCRLAAPCCWTGPTPQ